MNQMRASAYRIGWMLFLLAFLAQCVFFFFAMRAVGEGHPLALRASPTLLLTLSMVLFGMGAALLSLAIGKGKRRGGLLAAGVLLVALVVVEVPNVVR